MLVVWLILWLACLASCGGLKWYQPNTCSWLFGSYDAPTLTLNWSERFFLALWSWVMTTGRSWMIPPPLSWVTIDPWLDLSAVVVSFAANGLATRMTCHDARYGWYRLLTGLLKIGKFTVCWLWCAMQWYCQLLVPCNKYNTHATCSPDSEATMLGPINDLVFEWVWQYMHSGDIVLRWSSGWCGTLTQCCHLLP